MTMAQRKKPIKKYRVGQKFGYVKGSWLLNYVDMKDPENSLKEHYERLDRILVALIFSRTAKSRICTLCRKQFFVVPNNRLYKGLKIKIPKQVDGIRVTTYRNQKKCPDCKEKKKDKATLRICACGCGLPIPADKRSDKKTIDNHRKRISNSRRTNSS